jgi:hypothetical protein
MTFEVDNADFPIGKSLLVLSPSVADCEVPGLDGMTYGNVISEGFRLRMVSDALTGERRSHLQCPHVACPIHASGICRGWIPPAAIEECNFPRFLAEATGHKLDKTGRYLVPVSEDEGR